MANAPIEDAETDLPTADTRIDIKQIETRDRSRTVLDPVEIQFLEGQTEGIVSPEAELGSALFHHRYLHVSRIGEGGMGEVDLYDDQQVGRQVAVKALKRDQAGIATARSRFLREARVQGQLEHPSIVPVYDMGETDGGQIYFTMQRIRGISLEELFDDLESGDPEVLTRYSRRRLLTAFGHVCLAVDYAHRRGILHRDLKPANIMLGDYGEVFVIDWGLAKVEDGVKITQEMAVNLPMTMSPGTASGVILGTPGFMSPEQLRGQHTTLTPASDVYSLGAILFELCTHRPLHDPSSGAELFKRTLNGVEARPSVRCPERMVPIDLERIIVRATALDAKDRYPTARELNDDIEAFLDGERHDEQRREMAMRHSRAAQSAAADAYASIDARRLAIQEVGRTLALDPDNEEATDILRRLLTVAPYEPPPEVVAELDAVQRNRSMWAGRLGALGYLSVLLFLPFALWMGVSSWWAVVPLFVLSIASALIAGYVGIRGANEGVVAAVALVSTLTIAFTSSFFGPLVLTPAMVATNTTAFSIFLTGAYRWLTIAAGAAAVVFTVFLSLVGVIPGGYEFGPAGMTVLPGALELPEVPSIVLLVIASLVTVVMPALLVSKLGDGLRQAEQRLYLQSWHFRELLPDVLKKSEGE